VWGEVKTANEGHLCPSSATASSQGDLQQESVWHEAKIADDGYCGFNTAAHLLKHHLPNLYNSEDLPKASLPRMREWLSKALKQDLKLDQMPRTDDGLRPSQADDLDNLQQFVLDRADQVPAAASELCQGQLVQAAKSILAYIGDNSNDTLPYWMHIKDWTPLSKYLVVNFVLHNVPGCNFPQPSNPGQDLPKLNVQWSGKDGRQWGHWDALLPSLPH